MVLHVLSLITFNKSIVSRCLLVSDVYSWFIEMYHSTEMYCSTTVYSLISLFSCSYYSDKLYVNCSYCLLEVCLKSCAIFDVVTFQSTVDTLVVGSLTIEL